jgi:tetratricopeptide (TPR) repeat protein
VACLQRNLLARQGEQRSPSFGSTLLPAVLTHVWMVWRLTELGEFAEGLVHGDAALQVAEVVDRSYERLAVYIRVGYLQVRQGTLHTALPLLEWAVALSQGANTPVYDRLATRYLALAYALAGRATDALTLLEKMLGNPDQRLDNVYGEAYLLAGCVEEAHQLAQRALSDTRHRTSRGWEVQALWLLGEIARRRDPPEIAPAETSY